MRHPEPLLFIHDQQTEIFIFHIFTEQTVCPDHDIDTALAQLLDRFPLLFCRPQSREHSHFNAEIPHPLYKGIIMLPSQYRCRNEHRHLFSVHNRLKSGPYRNLGLSVADITTDKAVHALLTFHVRFCVLDGAHLVFRFLIGEQFLKFLLPHGILFKRMPFPGLPLGVQIN